MKKIRLNTSRVLGTGEVQAQGDIIELPAAEAAELVKRGQAVYVK
jgi:hypothetical protein